MVAAKQSPEFTKAIADSKTLSKTPTNDELLELYALFKQGNQDPKFEDAPKAGAFDFKGKAKYNKWSEFKDLSAADAQKKYVQLVKDLAAKYN
ncbi:hypothetical protein Q7P36_002572 [Cladosporium allicinum]